MTQLRLIAYRCDGEPIYEEHLGQGLIRIFKNDPRYCQVEDLHEDHEYFYEYVRLNDGIFRTRGHYYCDGDPATYAPIPEERAQCCCQWGAAVGARGGVPSGEWPEFECADCPVHLEGLGPVTERCRRHRREHQLPDHEGQGNDEGTSNMGGTAHEAEVADVKPVEAQVPESAEEPASSEEPVHWPPMDEHLASSASDDGSTTDSA